MVGLKPVKIEIEVDISRGQPKLVIIGLPSQTVTEAKERITAALQNCGIRIKAKRTIVNLAPADIRKKESCFELAIVASLLKEYGIFHADTESTMFFGELALNGEIKPMKAALPLLVAASNMGYASVLMPAANVKEVEHLNGIKIFPVKHLRDLIDFAKGKGLIELEKKQLLPTSQKQHKITLADIYGHEQAKRALEVAAAGGHNLLMIGPPGSGKSMLAQAITSLLPPLHQDEATEISIIHSLVGELKNGLITHRPLRHPHHSTTSVSLIGGGIDLLPGEISLAHKGVLFLDEINEFSRSSLEALREPLEQGIITIKRSTGTAKYPARFTLIAAANPCPCGYAGSQHQKCHCNLYQIRRYQSKLSGPLKDRIDLQLFIEPVSPHQLEGQNQQQDWQTSAVRVEKAYSRQAQRYKNTRYSFNSELDSRGIRKHCFLTDEASRLLLQAAKKLPLTNRGYFSVIKVSQTIADLASAAMIEKRHLAEALQYRMLQ